MNSVGDLLLFRFRPAFIKGLTQADLSERTGLSRPWINQFEQGKIENASIGRILTLCNALGITLTVSYGTPEETNETAPSNAQLSLSMPGHTLMSRAMRFWKPVHGTPRLAPLK